ncbi:hypothetical protein L2E82_19347 [Cichorium intybus]|uniref:Uncharacterized protein n=1 Tax=Cichorium intybus TaxID=13427 RepID=A0ACB9FBS1_CICIN|nr:hypothetical protein L2E82_19347 [Cichorium intybus]
MRTRRGGQLSPLHFDLEIERTARKNHARRRLGTRSFSHVSSSIEDVTHEPSGEVTGAVPFIPPISEFQFGSMSATGDAVSAPASTPSCTPPSVPPFQPQSTNPFTSAMSWGAPTRDGTPVTMQHTTISQPQSQPSQPPLIFKPQTISQTKPQQQYQPQPSQQQY